MIDFPFNQEMDDALVQQEIARHLRSLGYTPGPTQPEVQQAPGLKLGPLRLSGSGLDAAAQAMQGVLSQGLPNGGGFGGGLAAGLVGGWSGARAGQARSRAAANAQSAEDAAAMDKEKRGQAGAYARELANHRWQTWRESQKQVAGDNPDDWVTVTPEIRDYAAKSRIAIPPGVARVKRSELVRDLPQEPDPTLHTLRAQLEEQRRQAQEAAVAEEEQTAKDIVAFRTKPVLADRKPEVAMRVRSIVNQMLSSPDAPRKANGSPYSIQELETLWNQKEQFGKTQNSQRFQQVRQSALTAREHIKQFEEFYDTYRDDYEKAKKSRGWLGALNPGEVRAFNKGLLTAARDGFLGPDAAADASALEATVGPLSREVAMVFSSGYAPEKAELEEAHKNISAAVGPRGHLGQLKALRGLLKARIEVFSKALPAMGGRTNPYLLDMSPLEGWNEAESADAPQRPTPVAPKATSDFERDDPDKRRRR